MSAKSFAILVLLFTIISSLAIFFTTLYFYDKIKDESEPTYWKSENLPPYQYINLEGKG